MCVPSFLGRVVGFCDAWWCLVVAISLKAAAPPPAATATIKLFVPSLVDNQNAVTVVASGWLVVIGGVVAKGIKLTSYTQIVFTVVEVGVVALLIALAAMCYPSAPAHAFSFAWFTGADFTPSLFAGGALIALFAFSGWDVTVNLNEETRDGARIAGRGSILAVVIVSVLLVGFGALALLLLSYAKFETAGINIVFAVEIAFCYGLAGLACAWDFRRQALTSVGKFIFLLAWPLLGAGFCIFIAAYSVPTFDLTTNVVGIGSIAIGIVPYLSNRSAV